MPTSLSQLIRMLVASVALVAFLLPCICAPCGVIGLLGESGEHAKMEEEASASTGCCPGDDAAEDEHDAHDCQHCGVDYVLATASDRVFDDGASLAPLPPLLLGGVPFVDLSTTWVPVVEPVVVRRANPPPAPHYSPTTADRLALLSRWLC